MSFLKKFLANTLKSAFSLRTHFKSYCDKHHLITPKIKDYIQKHLFSKRMSSVILLDSKGSLTVEAALVIPIFLFAVMAILSFVKILQMQIAMDGAMQQCAKELAVYGYVQTMSDTGKQMELPMAAEALFSEIYVKHRVETNLGADYKEAYPVQGELYFLNSRIMEEDRIELHSTYYVLPFFSLSPTAGFLTGQTAVARAFTGYDNEKATKHSGTEEYVFISEYGTAYHRDRGCSYLDLSIQKGYARDLYTMRNKDGKKYDACESCVGTIATNLVFVTDYGEAYHSDILCSGLRRTIESVPISQVGGRTPCPKCK